jgi:hypothetical protein
MYNNLRNLSLDNMDMDDAVQALAVSKLIAAEYGAQSVPVPEWLSENIGALTAEIKSMRRDYLASRLKSARARIESLKSRDERRVDLTNEIAQLEQQLAG